MSVEGRGVRSEDDELRWGRGVAAFFLCILGLITAGAIAVFVFTGTDWGRERVRGYAENWLNGIVHGRARIGGLSGNLLTGMTVHDFSITDSAGAPFIAVDAITGNYSVMALLRKHIWVDGAHLVRPVVVLDRPPNGLWNWERIFPRDTTPKPPTQQTGWLDWLRFTNATVVDGQLVMRTPWTPSGKLSAAGRDSVVRDALAGGSRLMIRQAPGGFQKIIQLDSVTGAFPLVRLSEPGIKNRLIQVSALTMNAYPFRPPGAAVRDVKGSFPFNNDSVWWKGAYVALPNSKATGDGSYAFSSGDLAMTVHSDPASLADLRWIYPRLPAGGGKLDLELSWKGATQDYLGTNADVSVGNAHAAGDFGLTLTDSVAIHDTNVRFTGVDTRLLEQLIPNFKSPRRGVFSGRAKVSGGIHALTMNADVTFADQRAGSSRVVAVGEVGFMRGAGLRARNLDLQLLPVQVDLARSWMPSLPISGTVTGRAQVNGSTTTALAVVANLNLRDRGTESVVDGKGTIRTSGGQYFDVDATASPVSLVEIGRFAPAIGLQGSATGPVHVVGSLRNLRVNADLRLPDGGRFVTEGALDLASKNKGYDLTSTLYTLNLRTIDSKAPVTSLSAHATVRGTGTTLATMRTSVVADLSTSRWDSIAVDTASVSASVSNGLLDVQRLYAHGAHTSANVSGTFGLTREQRGSLTYVVNVDSLGAFNRWLPKSTASTKAVAPRPQVVQRAVARARADSARVAKATEMERMINGRAAPALNVALPQSVPTDTVSGSAYAAGKLSGNLYDFDLRGRAGGENVVARGNFVRRFQSEYVWTNARTPQSMLAVGLDADSVSAMGFGFDTLSARVTYQSPGGHVELAVTQGGNRDYGLKGDYALYTDRKELRLADMTFRFDTAYWAMPHEGLIEWGGPGLRVTNFELRNRGNGRVYANGLLPTSGVADFTLDVDNFPVANIIDLVQTDINMTGMISLAGSMSGTLSNPAFKGAYGLLGSTYNGAVVPELHGTFGYADMQLVTHVDALRNGGTPMMVADARLPINLAFTGVTGDRLLPDPMQVDVVADSLPLELIPQFTGLVTNVHGRAAGKFSMRGTLKQPSLVGALALDKGSLKLVSTGATFTDMTAVVRMANDTVYVDSVSAKARGDVRLRGNIAVGDWRQPSFNLYLIASGAELLNNDIGDLRVDAGVALTGPFNRAFLSGATTITQGVIYAPETSGQHLLGAGDPALFNVLDTTNVNDRDLFPPTSPLVANLRVEMTIGVNHNTWVRNREANIEIYTDDPVSIRYDQQALLLTGVVTTDRGEYNVLSKRFQIKRGSAMFVGTPDLNPTLQITGEYEVQAPRGAVNISVEIGGTLKKPKLSLTSDAQPPQTQSELLSLLAFGQSTTSLLSFTSSSIAGGEGASDLFGAGARIAVTRLAGVALGVAVDQMEVEAGRAFGTDILDITPGDVPLFNGGNAFTNFVLQTKVEAGKYINGRTFLSVQEQARNFGAGIEHRTADGWHFNASIEPRVLLLEPRLNSQPYRSVITYGGFILREWRF
ncbi:MAG TPA: translocation/assembly module TamB domain-containing protein [Gemmatimonadaceae bacterium]